MTPSAQLWHNVVRYYYVWLSNHSNALIHIACLKEIACPAGSTLSEQHSGSFNN